MPTRTARTGWTGTLEQGVGQVELTSSKIGTYEVSFPKRTAEDAGGTTSPEELIAAAHSACYAMQLSALIAQAGGTPQALDVQADVSLGPDPAGGFRLTGIKLTVRGEVEGRSLALGNSPEFWLNAQRAVDLWDAVQAIEQDVARIKPLSLA